MMWSALVIYGFFGIASAITGTSHSKAVICYRKFLDRVEKRNIFNQCTHLIAEGVPQTMPWDLTHDFVELYYKKYLDAREEYPHLRIILGIPFTDELIEIAADQSTRYNFIRRALNYMMHYSFDGLDLYWDSRRYNKADKEKLVLFIKEIRMKFKNKYLLLTSTFGSYDNDNKFNGNDSRLHQMSKQLDFMSFSNKSTIIDLIKTGVPTTKIVIQQQLDGNNLKSFDPMRSEPYFWLCKMINAKSKVIPFEISCDVEQCRVVTPHAKVYYFENARHIANKMRFAMRHNLAGALVFSPSNDDTEGKCPIDKDITFSDFGTMNGINLKIPTPSSRLEVVNDAITVSLNEISQEAQLREKRKTDHPAIFESFINFFQ